MSANSDDNHQPDPRERFRDRLADIRNQRKGAICGLAVLGGLAVILVTNSSDHLGSIAPFSYGVACGVGAIVMITNVGALSGHKISAEIGLVLAEEVAKLRAEVATMRETLAAIIASGADDLAQRRRRDAR